MGHARYLWRLRVQEQVRLGDTQGQPDLEPQVSAWGTLLVQASWFENSHSLAHEREEGHARDEGREEGNTRVTQNDSEVTVTASLAPVLFPGSFCILSVLSFAGAQAELMHYPLEVGRHSLATVGDSNPTYLLMQGKPIG